jgi:hypothetical protein
MHYTSIFVLSSSLILSARAQLAHLDCAVDPNSNCNVGRYCEWTQNNVGCTFDWQGNTNVPTFVECVICKYISFAIFVFTDF